MNGLDEKTAVSDMLSVGHSAVKMLTTAILESDNTELRNILIDMRNKFESTTYDIYLVAKQKGYYVPAAPAGKADIEQVKQAVSK